MGDVVKDVGAGGGVEEDDDVDDGCGGVGEGE